jgi:hypothetical protein
VATEAEDVVFPEVDYAQSIAVWNQLVEVRFKLLALVPVVTGLGVGLLGNVGNVGSFRVTLVAFLGLVTVLALMAYDLRNSMLHDVVVHRLKKLEAADLKFKRRARRFDRLPEKEREDARKRGVDVDRTWPLVLDDDYVMGGVFAERPASVATFLGFRIQHDSALALAYLASAGAWTVLVAYSALARLTDLDATQLALLSSLLSAVVVAALVVGTLRYRATMSYVRHVLTGGVPTEPWPVWDEPRTIPVNVWAEKMVHDAERATGISPVAE